MVCGLASVLVGDRPDSDLYVESKAKAAERCGFFSLKVSDVSLFCFCCVCVVLFNGTSNLCGAYEVFVSS